MMTTTYWVLYDPDRKTQTDKLTDEQAQFSLLKMKTKEVNNFLIWRIDWPKWKKLREFLTSPDSPFMSTFFNSPVIGRNDETDQASSIPMKPVDKETEELISTSFSNVQLQEVKLSQLTNAGQQQYDADQLSPDHVHTKPNLSFKTLDKTNIFSKNNKDDKNKLELLLIHLNGNMFRTIAKDISLSGTFCEKIIPNEFHHSVFDLVIINNFIKNNQYNRLTIKTKIIILDPNIYLEYVNPTTEQKASLREILEYYVRQTQVLKK